MVIPIWLRILKRDKYFMLQENKIGKIISFKTTNGDEVVGKVTGQSTDELTIQQPVILAASQQGLAMVPFLMTADMNNANVVFKTSNIICSADTSEGVADAYFENTTGIKPIRSGIIT